MSLHPDWPAADLIEIISALVIAIGFIRVIFHRISLFIFPYIRLYKDKK